MQTIKWGQVSAMVFLLGTALSFAGLIQFFSKDNGTAEPILKTSLTQRDLAIANALKTGQNSYSYTSNFIPGIGEIRDPESYKKNWEEQMKSQLNTNPTTP